MKHKLPLTAHSIRTNPEVRKALLQIGVIALVLAGLVALQWVLTSQ